MHEDIAEDLMDRLVLALKEYLNKQLISIGLEILSHV